MLADKLSEGGTASLLISSGRRSEMFHREESFLLSPGFVTECYECGYPLEVAHGASPSLP
jgi:hypothetical protein